MSKNKLLKSDIDLLQTRVADGLCPICAEEIDIDCCKTAKLDGEDVRVCITHIVQE